MTYHQLSFRSQQALELVFGPDMDLVAADGPSNAVVCRGIRDRRVIAIEAAFAAHGECTHEALDWAARVFRSEPVGPYRGPMWPGYESFERRLGLSTDDGQLRLGEQPIPEFAF